MSCMHCIVYALHSHIVSWCLLPGDQLRLAWEHLRPASFCYMDAVQASSDLLTGQEIHRTTWTCFNMLHHASDILHQDNKVAQAGTSTSRFTPRGASILAMQKKKRNQTEALYTLPWQSWQLTANHAVQVLLQYKMLKGSKGNILLNHFFRHPLQCGIQSSLWKTQWRDCTATPFEWPAKKPKNTLNWSHWV